MSHKTAKPYLACMVLLRRGDKAAFVLRTNTKWMNGYYGVPAGKVEVGERATAGAVREAYEEAGVVIKESDLRIIHVCHRYSRDDDQETWIDMIFETDTWEGEPYNAEPHKHGELIWFDLSQLPENLIPAGRFFLNQIAAGKTYSEYGWEGQNG